MNTKLAFCAAAAVAAIALSNPASAAVFTYTMTNGDVLTVDNTTGKGTLRGTLINAAFTSTEFATFQGGLKPATTTALMFNLATLTGTYNINGTITTPNASHQQKLIFNTNNTVNLWSYWGNPIIGGDYVTTISKYTPPPTTTTSTGGTTTSTGGTTTSTGGTPVPAPGILGLFGLGMAGLAFGRRRKSPKVNSVKGKFSFA